MEKDFGIFFCRIAIPLPSSASVGPTRRRGTGPGRDAKQTNQPTNKQETPPSKQIGTKDTAEAIHREDQGNRTKQAPRILSLNDTQSGSIKELTNSGHGNATPYRSTGLVHVASKTKCRETPASKQIRMKDTADVVHREDKGKQKKTSTRDFLLR